jgi:hypothetical protein
VVAIESLFAIIVDVPYENLLLYVTKKINLRDKMSDCILLTVEEFNHLKKYKWCRGRKQDSKEVVTVNVMFEG